MSQQWINTIKLRTLHFMRTWRVIVIIQGGFNKHLDSISYRESFNFINNVIILK